VPISYLLSHTKLLAGANRAIPGACDDQTLSGAQLDPAPSQWLRARCMCRTTITDVFCLHRYISEGDDAGVASEDDDDDDAEEEVEEEEDAEAAAARKSLARSRSRTPP